MWWFRDSLTRAHQTQSDRFELDLLGSRYLEKKNLPKLRLSTATKKSAFSPLSSESGVCHQKDKSWTSYHWSNLCLLHFWALDGIQINPFRTQLCSCHFSSYETLMDEVLPPNISDFLTMLELLLEPMACLVGVSPPASDCVFLFLIKGYMLSCWLKPCPNLSEPPKITLLRWADFQHSLRLMSGPPFSHRPVLSWVFLWIPSVMLSSCALFFYGGHVICSFALRPIFHPFSTLLCIIRY